MKEEDEQLEERTDTHGYIPKELKTRAYNLYGRQGCVLCGTKGGTDLHHIHLPQEENNPYLNTKPWQLIPLCRSCHRKVELIHRGGLLRETMYWIVKKKRAEWQQGDYKKTLQEYLDDKIEQLKEDDRIPLKKYFPYLEEEE